jgi:hypothetical protein
LLTAATSEDVLDELTDHLRREEDLHGTAALDGWTIYFATKAVVAAIDQLTDAVRSAG